MNRTVNNVDRARAYLAKCPPAIQGQGGDNATYRLACVLTNDFALSDSDAWPLMLEWNSRCLPPWPESALRTKLRSALRCVHPKPRGNKLTDNPTKPRFTVCPASASTEPTPEQKRAAWPEFRTPSKTELRQVGEARNVSPESLRLIIQRGMLFTARCWGLDCWIVADPSRTVAQARRLDGMTFDDNRKAITLPGSIASLPVGAALLADFPNVMLVEGTGDLLAAFHFICVESREADCHAVAMLGANQRIAESVLPMFSSKCVRLYPHADDEGRRAAGRWTKALLQFASKIDGLAFNDCHRLNGALIKDLGDVTYIDPDDFERDRGLWSICPPNS